MDVILQGLVGLLLAALEVLGIPRVDIRPLEISDEDPLEVHLVADAVMREEFEPCSNMFPHVDGEVLNDEVVIIHSSGSVGEPEVFEPYTRICFLGVFGDVGRRSEALWEWRFLDATAKDPWSRAIRARTPVVWSATMPRACFPAPLDGPVGARATCSHRPMMDVIITSGLTPIVDDTMSVSVRPKAFAHRWSVWSGCRVRPWCSYGLLFHAWWL